MARFTLACCFAFALTLAFGCGGTPAGNSGDAGAEACGGATSTVLEGSCTITIAGLSSCAEDSYSHQLTSSEVDVMPNEAM